jgi:GDPmannose 4,6-dehydratase
VTRKITKGVARISRAIHDCRPFVELQLGNLDSKRDWSFAEDIVEGIWLMLNNAKPVDLVLASGVSHSIREFVEIAFEIAGISGSWSGSGTSEVYRAQNDGKVLVSVNERFYRKLEVDVLVGNATKARTVIGWNPKLSFRELVTKMVVQDLEEVGLSV